MRAAVETSDSIAIDAICKDNEASDNQGKPPPAYDSGGWSYRHWLDSMASADSFSWLEWYIS